MLTETNMKTLVLHMRVLRFPYVSHIICLAPVLLSRHWCQRKIQDLISEKHDLRILTDTDGTYTKHKSNTDNICEPNIRETELDLWWSVHVLFMFTCATFTDWFVLYIGLSHIYCMTVCHSGIASWCCIFDISAAGSSLYHSKQFKTITITRQLH